MTKNKKLMIIFSVVIALAALIILNSVLFSVQHVNAACLNDNDMELDQAIEAHHGIRYGSSIFVLNEQKAAETIKKNLTEQGIGKVKILSLERKFPNRVVIHYIKIVNYFYVLQDGQAYYFSNHDAALTEIKPAGAAAGNTIELKIDGILIGTEIGNTFASSTAGEHARISALLSAFERTEGLPFSNLNQYFDFVDIKGQYIYIKTVSGVYFQFHSLDNFIGQFAMALSAYSEFRDDPTQVVKTLSGTIVVNPTNPVTAAYNPANLYVL